MAQWYQKDGDNKGHSLKCKIFKSGNNLYKDKMQVEKSLDDFTSIIQIISQEYLIKLTIYFEENVEINSAKISAMFPYLDISFFCFHSLAKIVSYSCQ